MAATDQPTRRPVSRRWQWLLLAGGAVPVGVFLLLFGAPRLIPSRWLVPRLEGLLSKALGAPVQLAKAQATSFLPLTIAVQDATLGQNRPEDRLTGTIRRAEFGIGWLNLFRQRPTFTHLTVQEAAIRLTAGPASSSPAASVPALRHLATAFLSATDAAAPADAGTFTIETLTVSDCSLRWSDTPFAFEHLHTTGQVRGRDVALGRTTADWLGGKLDATAARLTFAPERLGFAITGRLTDLPTEQLARPPETPAVTGRGTFRLDVIGQYAYEPQRFEGLTGSGDVVIREGSLPRLRPGIIGRTMTTPSLPSQIGGFELGSLRERLLGPAEPKPEPPPNPTGLTFREMTFRFELEGTLVKLDGLTCDVEEGRQVTGKGTVSLAERPSPINFDLRFPLNFVTGGRGNTLPLLGALSERQMVPVRVTGTFERPVIEIIGLSL
ncbi:MAG: AsmA-like C-terminal region-containing protein [Chloracidobacterium sp.]|uniref:AsmA-like C-terminal domain-containing protein n=1 Tax=Chloracidobacterium validum TaxID=2821543 RepID=A0ABX8BDK5_9BACT|nr:AsmA-like C-terminal region-containing protein [Chloracidobacterium validum]QUW04101.1 hypothetical protein J8C06_13700 [Chloracidobacterium validum]